MINNLVLVTNIPSPYRIPLWDKVKDNIDLEVICIATNEKNRQWKTEQRSYISFLKSYHFLFQQRDWALHFSIPFSLFFSLIKKHPDAVMITGYDSPQYWEALFYAKMFRKKKILWNGSTSLSARSQNKIVGFLKNYFINSFDTFYTYGTKASEYLESFGIDSEQIINGINTVDTDYYKIHTSSKSKKKDGILKFLYVGQLIERKGVSVIVDALFKLNHKDWFLTIVGSGEDEKKLKEKVRCYGLENKIIFVGYKQKNEIVEYYSEADVFLMPSYLEVWGLVLNEALSSGLFCLSSKYAGATFDLIQNGKNGFIIDPKDINDVILKLDMTFTTSLNKKKIKSTFNVSYKYEAQKIIKAVQKA